MVRPTFWETKGKEMRISMLLLLRGLIFRLCMETTFVTSSENGSMLKEKNISPAILQFQQ